MRVVRSNAALTAGGPIAFGGSFLAPLIALSLEAAAAPAPLGSPAVPLGPVPGTASGGGPPSS